MSINTPSSYQDKRRQAIEDAAYKVLAQKGYKAASMLAIARQAKASNETLYNWYGNKQKLFESLVHANTQNLRSSLEDQIEPLNGNNFFDELISIGVLLLQLVTSERAIALNRAAAGDVHDTATLGWTIAKGGKQSVLPLLERLFQDAGQRGELSFEEGDQIAEVWISLLIGDLQIRRVIGVQAELSDQEIEARAKRAANHIIKLFGA